MIPFVDLKAQYRSIKPELDDAVLRVLGSGRYILGEEVTNFEREFAVYCGTKHAIAVNSGTSALHLSLLAAGIGAGDEVITVPFTFVATVSAISYTGARPVFVDTEPGTLTMDPARIEAAITARTKAVVPVHLYGQVADMDAICQVAEKHGLPVIEDACQAHGAEYRGRRAGSFGTSGCFSFYPGKNLGACGEGGIVVTDDERQMNVIRMLRDWGQEQRYHHALKGFNYRMDSIQGAVLRVKLRHLDHWIDARRQHARTYSSLLAGSGQVTTPVQAPNSRHVFHIYAVRTADRERLQHKLKLHGIETGIHYPIPVHLQAANADLGYREGDFPIAEAAARDVLSLPMYPEMTSGEVAQVAAVVEQIADAA